MKKLKDFQKEMKKPCKACKQVKCGCEMNEEVETIDELSKKPGGILDTYQQRGTFKGDKNRDKGKALATRKMHAPKWGLEPAKVAATEAVVDKSEVGYKGEMAISQAKQIRHHLEELMSVLKVDTDLPEWVSSKMTLAADYVQTISDYLLAYNMKEDAELEEKRGLWDNIHAKQERIKHGSGEHMRKPGSKGAPTKADFKASQSKK